MAEVSAEGAALCVEDDPRVLDVLEAALAAKGLRALRCRTVAEALAALAVRPALAVVDLGLPDGSGTDVLRALAARWPDAPAVVLTADDRPAQVVEALRLGARGYVLKEDLHGRLDAVLDEARAGWVPLSAGVADAVLRRVRGPQEEAPAARLTAAERAVLEGLARGYSYEQCALACDVSVNTVRSHVRAAYRKLEASTKTEAVLAALRRGLITLG